MANHKRGRPKQCGVGYLPGPDKETANKQAALAGRNGTGAMRSSGRLGGGLRQSGRNFLYAT